MVQEVDQIFYQESKSTEFHSELLKIAQICFAILSESNVLLRLLCLKGSLANLDTSGALKSVRGNSGDFKFKKKKSLRHIMQEI